MDNKQPTKAYNDHNVYILGAGFSKEAGMPLINEFMNRMRDAAAWLEEQGGREREIKAIERVLEFRLRAAAAAYRVPLNVENVEELFSLASASGGEKLAQEMTLAIAATLDYARSTAPPLAEHQYVTVSMRNVADWTKPPNWKPPDPQIQHQVQSGALKGEWYNCPPYEFYLAVMCGYFNKGGRDRRDTIITLNYDTVVEDALKGLDIVPDYGFPEADVEFVDSSEWMRSQGGRRKVPLLKLHGSVNWLHAPPSVDDVINVRGTLQDESYAKTIMQELRRVQIGDYGNLRMLPAATPFLVPPTWQKTLTGILGKVWDAAVSALRTATRIIILGYSIPPTDQHFRYLLAAGLQENISLRKVFFVNPALAKGEEKTRLEEKLFGLFRREHFDQGIIELVPADIRKFLAGPHEADQKYRVRIGRPLSPPGHTWDTAPWTLTSQFPPASSFE